jgi:hypothetical protein
MDSIITPLDPQIIGDILYYILTTKEPYNKYNKIYQTFDDSTKIETYIHEVFSKYLGIKVNLNYGDFFSILQPGDIIKKDNRVYLITQVQGLEIPVTWPSLTSKDYEDFNLNSINNYPVTRPDYSSNKLLLSKIEQVSKEIISTSQTNQLLDEYTETLSNGDKDRIYEELGDGVLQIGDLIFIVDPTQIAFTTQNGYQYFPTIRTQGNPKIPTMEQVKNVSINLIFPNEDSINYQLLNLYAMFRRTPFVNIRNKDISAFFKDICYNDWLSVALESIQIQSVNGFPNTLQASITILPFDYRMISDGFQALKSIKDVERQQAVLYKNDTLDNLIRKSEAKLHEQSIVPERFIDIIVKDIQKSPDFRNSLPFRAFYQALIAERKFILDNHGKPVPINGASAYDLSMFRPSMKDSFLHEYRASDNQQPIEIQYSYIPNDFRTISKNISDERIQKQIDLLSSINKSLDNKEDIVRSFVTMFTTKDDFYKITEAKFHEIDNKIDTLLTRYNITIEKDPNEPHPIKNLFDLIVQGINVKIGTRGVGETLKDITSIVQGKIVADSIDVVGYLNGVTHYDTDTYGIGTFQWGIKKIYDWINSGTDSQIKEKKKNFSAFIVDMNQNIAKELGLIDTEEVLTINPQEDGELFNVSRLPIERVKVIIDNKKDIVTGWSLVFANKFIPINIQAFKYPYYQHLGSDDASLSLVITSTSEKSTDLKSQLSLLSERLHETVKTITQTAPELIVYLDSRLTINVGVHHIFNSFGIKKVVFDASNSVTIDGQPNCWNTTVNLTQANFTISQYHSITSVPSSDLARNEISKLVSYIEKDNDTFKIVKYRIKNDSSFKTINLEVNDIIRLKFLKKHGATLSKYIEDVRKQGDKLKEQRSGVTNVMIPGMTAGTKINSNDTSSGVVGGDIADKLYLDIKNSINIEEFIDPATTELQNLIIEYPEFKKILSFLISRIDNVIDQKLESFKQVIFPRGSLIQNFYLALKDSLGGELGVVAGAALLVSFFLIPPVGIAATSLALTITSFGGAVFIKKSIDAAAIAGQTKLKDTLISKFDNIFMSLEDTVSSSIALDFSDKVLRDPIIYKKLITPKILGNTVYENIEKLKNSSNINCYNDFDLPQISNIIIGPDFYLYNNTVNTSDTRMYINEATKRYAKIGKLTAMMTLVEAIDTLKKYDEIIDKTEKLEADIKSSLDSVITADLTTNTSITDIKKLITTLQNAQDQLALCINNSSEIESITVENQKVLNDFRIKYDKELNSVFTKEEYEGYYKVLASKLTKGEGEISVGDLDFRKLNLIKTARMKTMLEIFEIYSVLNSYMLEQQDNIIQNIGSTDKNNRTKSIEKLLNDTKSKAERDCAIKLYDTVRYILLHAQETTSQSFLPANFKSNTSENQDIIKGIRTQFDNGIAQVTDENSITLPGIYRLENYLYNKIGYYIRLNTFLQDYAKYGGDHGVARLDLSTLPELKYLDFWNFRAVEENQRKINILKDFTESNKNKKDTTIKMFPTFKLFFVEEDKTFITHNFDDYYTHNAIQSIEVISNKNSASKTAVIRLSNITNSLTDRMSLLRESEELYGYSLNKNNKAANLFFGTLDIKPGTQIIIKMGYAPFDNLLTTIFQGRIIEMNNGPMVEMICQSFGSQLNHQIVAEKFGLLSTTKDYGDIASAVLDSIPGLEKLGKPSMFGLSNTGDFTGKNIKNIRGKFGDKFLMSNLIGNLSSMVFAQDNPRDENIYLNYSATNNIYHHPTFDWVVFDQSVWEVLSELCLYHRNTISTIKPYNNDPLSSNNNLRETLVVGDKAGYYKFNDAFGLSTLNMREVDKAVKEFESIQHDINSFNITNVGIDRIKYDSNTNDLFYFRRIDKKDNMFDDRPHELLLNPKAKKLYNFLQNRLYSLVLVSYLITKKQGVKENINFLEAVNNLIVENRYIKDSFSELIYNMISFSKMTSIPEEYLLTTDFTNDDLLLQKKDYFLKIHKGLKNLNIENISISAEEFYNVKDLIINTDEKLANNPQYKKIQQHHLITDTSDIISNNITLNSNFSNVVNVYYTNEPQIKTASLDRLDDDYIRKNLNIWTVKAFGDQRDEFSRPLNSYQKNIDTNWFDVINKTSNFYESYSRVKLKSQKGLKKLFDKSKDEINIPSWDCFPSFVIVGVRLLQKEVSKMYQGTIELVGNPSIQPYDILHIQDYTNDMHGVIEVEEVIHTFTPDRGFRTVITPNLITFDRDPIQMQDIQIINQIYDFANYSKSINFGLQLSLGIVSAGAAVVGGVINPIAAIPGLIGIGKFSYNSTVGNYKRHHKFLFDQMGHILGRDCINFTSLLYHGLPYMAGFDGIDYTNLKTLMNHTVADIKNPITRYLSFGDTFLANITTGWNPEEFSTMKKIFGRYKE